jgi:hypothetical protein
MYSAKWIVSPESPAKTRRLCRFSVRDLSSVWLRTVIPRTVDLFVALLSAHKEEKYVKTKSFPRIANKTSMFASSCWCELSNAVAAYTLPPESAGFLRNHFIS